MALARVKVWIPGDVLTAADLNGEFNNVINNPITLISPTTGPINFNLQAHTNLLPSVITASSATTGAVLTASGGVTIWSTAASDSPANFTTMSSGQTLIGTSSGAAKSLPIGSTGQVLAVTSSNSDPAWQVIPPNGGLSTTVPSTGMVYYISTSGVLTGLTAGTSGQVLTLSTNIVPSWATPSASGSGGSASPGTFFVYEDFNKVLSTTFASITSTAVQSTNTGIFGVGSGFNGFTFVEPYSFDADPRGVLNVVTATGPVTMNVGFIHSAVFEQLFSTLHPTFTARYREFSTFVGQRQIGLSSAAGFSTANSGIFLLSTNAGQTVSLFCVSSSGTSSLSAGVTASSWHEFVVAITSSQVNLTVDGAAVGNITGNIWTSRLLPNFAYSGDPRPNFAGFSIDYFQLTFTSSNR